LSWRRATVVALAALGCVASPAQASPARAPAGPALASGASAYATPTRPGDESEPESAAGSEDPLVRNGLRSPFCELAAVELQGEQAGDCQTSGFLAAAAPSEDYAFDTNIDTTLGLSVDALLQDYLVRPIWMGLVWLTHGLLVALEWSYALDLVRGPLANSLAPLLRGAQAQLTDPWLASLLSVAGVLAAYHGLIRRRVAQTLGEAAAMLAMIAAAMFVIADPGATVGALSQWSDEASLGSLNAIAGERSAQPYAAFAASMQQLYAATIAAPWCFLEFGNVSWCDSPHRLDPRLRAAATRIAARIETEASGSTAARGIDAEVLSHRVQLLRQAQSNGAIFLALPANGPLRNSVKDQGSLLYVLCGGAPDATRCRGPTAAEAEFRANSGTLPRIGGVLVIALGVLGMLLLIGFVALRLLEAAIVCVLFLVLAPAAALAPTLGEAGRTAFKRWAGRLLGAATAKLLWSLVLAALLISMRLLLALQGLGWLTQWLLMGTLWWGVFLRRHGLLATVSPGHGPAAGRVPRAGPLLEDLAVARGRQASREAERRARRVRERKRAESAPSERRARQKRDEQEPAQRKRRRPRGLPSRTLDVEGLAASDVEAGETRRAASSTRHDAAPPDAGSMRREAPLPAAETPHTGRRPQRGHETAQASRAQAASTPEAGWTSRGDGFQQGDAPGRDAPGRDAPGRDAPGRDAPGRDAPGRDAPGRDAPGRDAPGRDARTARNALDRDLRARRQEQEPPSNPIMRDAFEVAQGRKRQLGLRDEEDD
jgi:hypothetical protein